jgi:hypothetical protein
MALHGLVCSASAFPYLSVGDLLDIIPSYEGGTSAIRRMVLKARSCSLANTEGARVLKTTEKLRLRFDASLICCCDSCVDCATVSSIDTLYRKASIYTVKSLLQVSR